MTSFVCFVRGINVGGRQMVLKWGNDASYCVEGVTQSNGVQHLVGPNGHITSGSCPQFSLSPWPWGSMISTTYPASAIPCANHELTSL